ncbi:orotidine-5'-phosphate decarboxylase [Dehalobacterium formicoaceticum]|uniref:Orotidine 5'-phosphate decarboxylase n=1 Tax=Dehalobacterium formicoaceticum TaxID=51515 RepID=A0ABT1Y155_9FIRM|nr:orotidine-5'-phosphate decarboxylase [Dehalobacterium formicoaceticum]MCR6544596.1 orotidine-5'-phosphate decarboxylase [Dehalobacterium formicoaceticum]
MKEKLIVALDVSTREKALRLAEQLWDKVGAFKVGMQLYNSVGPDIVKDIQALGGKVFVDLKFHDIPNTVSQASRIITGKGAFMFTLHASGGKEMMEKSALAVQETAAEMKITKPIVLAITVLTSISQEVFQNEVGIQRPIEDQVVEWAKLAQNSGIDGVVASPKEISAIRKACGPDFIIVTPGIRPLWAASNDQKRIMTPKEAVQLGATYLVVGRPITAQEKPGEAAQKIVTEMEEGIHA